MAFVIYADFESILEKIDVGAGMNTTNIQKHHPCAFSYLIKCSFKKENNIHRHYFGEDSADVFVRIIVYDRLYIYEQYLAKE